MITQMEKVIVDMIRKQLLGKTVPNKILGDTGRGFEDLLEDIGVPINRGNGIDSIEFGWENKTRVLGSTSAQTVGSVLPEDIIAANSWDDLDISKKIKKQLRADIDENGKIVGIDLFDFDQEFIQDLFREAFLYAQTQLSANPHLTYTKYKKEHFAYFENTDPKRTRSLDFRIPDAKMDKLKAMSKSTFSSIIEYGN